jgi:hypothetical protein
VITLAESESNHPAQVSNQVACRKASLQVNTGIFAGSIVIFFALFCWIRLLDTLDHFDYDSACAMILNLESRVSVAAVAGYRRASIWFATGRS